MIAGRVRAWLLFVAGCASATQLLAQVSSNRGMKVSAVANYLRFTMRHCDQDAMNDYRQSRAVRDQAFLSSIRATALAKVFEDDRAAMLEQVRREPNECMSAPLIPQPTPEQQVQLNRWALERYYAEANRRFAAMVAERDAVLSGRKGRP